VFAGVSPASQKSISFNAQNLTLYQKSIIGTVYGHTNPHAAVPQLLRMYRAGMLKMDDLVTREYRLEQINEAFADMLAGKNICGVIRFD
jgi:S-(hydroxymethyl)glutathione dehydrogenase/alcohol dehydrogenase